MKNHNSTIRKQSININRSVLADAGFDMLNRGVSKRIKNITTSAIKEMMRLSQNYPDAVSLAQGTPSFLTPKYIVKRIHLELNNNPDIGKYAPLTGLAQLKREIAKRLKKKRGIKADPKTEICVTVGAMQAVASAIMAITNPGDEIILFSPCFPSHIAQINLTQGKPIFALLDESNKWALDIDEFKSKISSKTKAVIICNPSNPTGTVFREEDLRAIAKLAQKHDFWLITDEPYDFLVYDNLRFFSISQIPEIKERLIACFSFSKEYAMSGYRIGWVYAQAGMINQMLKIHDAFTISAATVSQYAALAALQGSQQQTKYFVREFAKRRDLICRRLDQLPDFFSYHKPQGAYYIFPKIKIDIDDFDLAIRLLKEAKVAVVPGSSFGPNGKGHLRFCFAQSQEDINKAFDRITKHFHEKKYSYLIRRPKRRTRGLN